MGVLAAELNFDGGDAGFDEAARHDRGTAEVVRAHAGGAVFFHQLRVFALELEHLAFFGGDQAEAFIVDVAVRLGGIGELGAFGQFRVALVLGAGRHVGGQVRHPAIHEILFEPQEQALPTANAVFEVRAGAERLRRPNVFRRRARILHGERSVIHAQEPRAVRRAADANIRRQRDALIAGQLRGFVSEHGADRREADRGVRRIGGVHQLTATHVIAFCGRKRADDGEVVHLGRDLRHVLRNLNAAGGRLNFAEFAAGRLAWFEIPDVDGRGAAAHP